MADQPTIPLLNDRWEPIEPIGTGAMGEVWRGRHRVLGHDVAIKLMKHSAARDENLVARLVREARIAAQLRHRHIARVEDFGTTDDGRPFLVMELLKGESLEERLQAHGQVDPYLALSIRSICLTACLAVTPVAVASPVADRVDREGRAVQDAHHAVGGGPQRRPARRSTSSTCEGRSDCTMSAPSLKALR